MADKPTPLAMPQVRPEHPVTVPPYLTGDYWHADSNT